MKELLSLVQSTNLNRSFEMTTLPTQNERELEAEQLLREFAEYDGSPKPEALHNALAYRDELTPTLLEILHLASTCPISFIAEAG
jgi:hypothetical protein